MCPLSLCTVLQLKDWICRSRCRNQHSFLVGPGLFCFVLDEQNGCTLLFAKPSAKEAKCHTKNCFYGHSSASLRFHFVQLVLALHLPFCSFVLDVHGIFNFGDKHYPLVHAALPLYTKVLQSFDYPANHNSPAIIRIAALTQVAGEHIIASFSGRKLGST